MLPNPSILRLFFRSSLWRVLAIWPNFEATRTVRTPKRRSTTTCRLWSFLDSRGIHSLRPDQSVRHYPGHHCTPPLPFRCRRRAVAAVVTNRNFFFLLSKVSIRSSLKSVKEFLFCTLSPTFRTKKGESIASLSYELTKKKRHQFQ